MADFTVAAPVEQEKLGAYLHDKSQRPAPPTNPAKEKLRQWSLVIAGVLWAMGLCALVVQARDAWDSHRDWVPPAIMSAAAVAGVCLGYLMVRGRWLALLPSLLLLILASGLAALNIWRHESVGGNDALADATTIIVAILTAMAFISLIVTPAVVEKSDPTRPEATEV